MKDKIRYFEKYFDITLKCDVSKFIRIRNEITHTGKIPYKLGDITIDPLEEYELLRKVINKIIITLFNS